MKNFFAILLAWAFIIVIFGTLLAGFLLSSFWGILFFTAFILTIPTLIFVQQEEKIDTLEARISALENKNKENSND